MQGRILYTVGENASPELTDALSHDIKKLKSLNWVIGPNSVNKTQGQLLKDALRDAFRIKGQTFKESDEYKALGQNPITAQYEDALAKWVKRALFNNDEAAFNRFYNNNPESDPAFNLHALWSQGVPGVFASPMREVAMRISDIRAELARNTVSIPQPDYTVDFSFEDGKVKALIRYKLQIKHDIGSPGKFEVTDIPGDLKIEMTLEDKGFLIRRINPSNPLIEELITKDVVDVVEWLKRGENTEKGIFAAADSMRRDYGKQQAEYHALAEERIKRIEQLQAERAKREAAAARQEIEYRAKLERFISAFNHFKTNLKNDSPDINTLVTAIDEFLKKDTSAVAKMSFIDDKLEPSVNLLESQRNENADAFLNVLHEILPQTFADNAETLHKRADEMRRKAAEAAVEAIRKSRNEAVNKIAAATAEINREEVEATTKIEGIKKICTDRGREYAERLVAAISSEVSHIDPDMAMFLTIKPLDEAEYVEKGDTYVLTSKSVPRGIDLLVLKPEEDKTDSERKTKLETLRDRIIPQLSESTKIAIEKYQVIKITEAMASDSDPDVPNRDKLATIGHYLAQPATQKILNKQRDPITDAFVRAIKFLLPRAWAEKIVTTDAIKTEGAKLSEQVISTITPPRRAR